MTPPRFRNVYNTDSAAAAAMRNGWNVVDVGSRAARAAFPAGSPGLI